MAMDKHLLRIRSIFLTLVVSCSALIVGVSSNLETEKALKELDTLEDGFAGLDLLAGAKLLAVKEILLSSKLFETLKSQEIPRPTTDGITIENGLENGIYSFWISRPFVFQFEGDKQIEFDVDLQLFLYFAEDPEWYSQDRPSGLSDFRHSWNKALSSIRYVSDLDLTSLRYQFNSSADYDRVRWHYDRGRTSYTFGMTLWPGDDSFVYGDVWNYSPLGIIGGVDLFADRDSDDFRIYFDAQIEELVSPNKWCDLLPSLRPYSCANFEDAFPSLDKAIERHPDGVDIPQMRTLLETEKLSEGSIKLAGFEVAGERTLAAAVLAINAIVFYLLAHLNEVSRLSKNDKKSLYNQQEVWIGMFPGLLPRSLTLLGVAVLPLASIGWVSWVSTNEDSRLLFALIVSSQFLIVSFVSYRISSLWPIRSGDRH